MPSKSMPTETVRLVAYADLHALRYAESRIKQLERAMAHMQRQQQRYDSMHRSYRLTVHMAGLALALIVTLVMLGIALPNSVKLGLTFVPSVALEVIDKYLKF